MKISEGIVGDPAPALYQRKLYGHCPNCGKELIPGYMNIAKHWMECPNNPKLLKALKMKSSLLDEIKRTVKI